MTGYYKSNVYYLISNFIGPSLKKTINTRLYHFWVYIIVNLG